MRAQMAEVTHLTKSATSPQLRLAPVLIFAAMLHTATAVTAAEVAAPNAPATASQRLQQRFTDAVEGWRKAASKLPGQKPHEEQLMRDLRVIVAPTPLPLLRVHRRLDGHTAIVSAGWLALLEELLRAEAVSEGVEGDEKHCLSGYADAVMVVVRDNRDRAAKQPPQPLRAWPRLASLIEAGDAPFGCRQVHPARLRSAAVQARVDKAADSAAFWLLTRQAALLVAMRVPVQIDAAKAVAASNLAPAGLQWTCSALAAQPSTSASASAASIATSGTFVVALDAAVSYLDKRSQQALDCYGLEQPAALSWLRKNAAQLLDEQTVHTLSR